MRLQRNNHGEYQLMTANGDLLYVLRSWGQITNNGQAQSGWEVVRINADRVEWTDDGEPFISCATRHFLHQYSTPIRHFRHRLLSEARRAVAQEAQRITDEFLNTHGA